MMTQKKTKKIYERKIRKEKGTPVSKMVEVKTDGTESEIVATIAALKKKGCKYFEVRDPENKKKTEYKLAISGKNYAEKVSNL